ncbi:MAG TPA: alkaline phosphatase family protein, partial [Nitrososphaerales archaeon]|nr:alkaline phosphatase family protein [Nitrososphaerales archaeon]
YLTWANKRTLVVGIPFIHPAPKINGIFVTGRFSPKPSWYPENAGSLYDLKGFNYDDLSMEEKTEKIFAEGSDNISTTILEGLECRTATMSKMLDSEKWDVAIIVEGLPDDLLHLSYGDNAIVDRMYLALDLLVGQIMKRMTPDDSLIIFSDHGFCKIENVLFLNEWLLKQQYTSLDETLLSRFLIWLGLDWDALSENGFTSRVFRFSLSHLPWLTERIKNSIRSGMIVDERRRMRTSKVSAFSINEPLAWIRISQNQKNSVPEDQLISQLEKLKAEGLLKNVFETDKIYSGKFVRFAPGKILVEAPDGWAVDTLRWNQRKLTGKPLFTKKGVHRREGILLTYGCEIKTDSPRIHDLVPTVLHMLKLPVPQNIDGRSLLIKKLQEEPTRLLHAQ